MKLDCMPYVPFVLLAMASAQVNYDSVSDDPDKYMKNGNVTYMLNEAVAFEDALKRANKSGCSIELCNNPLQLGFPFQESGNNGSCRCDDNCKEYNDCCIDVAQFDYVPKHRWKCFDSGSLCLVSGVYVIQSCPRSWQGQEVRRLCENEAIQQEEARSQYLQDFPVLSTATKLMYKNIYCAVCHGDTQLYTWKATFACSSNHSRRDSNEADAKFDLTNATYVSNNLFLLTSGGATSWCKIQIEQCGEVFETFGVRGCDPRVNTCNVYRNMTKLCNAYTSEVFGFETAKYKNFHCALCNGVDLNNFDCKIYDSRYDLSTTDLDYDAYFGFHDHVSLTFVFDFNFGHDEWNQVGFSKPCQLSENFLWDPIGQECIRVENNTSKFEGCQPIILGEEYFEMSDNGSIYVNYSGKWYAPEEFELYEEANEGSTSVIICAEREYLLPRSPSLILLSKLTMSLSLICLIALLGVYVVLPKLRNCPGKVLMSLCSALLCGQFCLLIGEYVQPAYEICYAIAALIHFSMLSTFCWMNVMAYDIYRTFLVSQRCRDSNRSGVLFKYSAYAWLAPFVPVTIAMITNTTSIENEFNPSYGDPLCWFNKRKPLFLLFGMPVGIILFTNLLFFVKTAVNIRHVTKQTRMANPNGEKQRCVLYVKLSIILGLTWIVGFFAPALNMDILWYFFIVLNGSQGCFIFVLFVMKKTIINMLFEKFKFAPPKWLLPKGKRHSQTSSSSVNCSLELKAKKKRITPNVILS